YKAEDDPEFEGWRTRPAMDLIKQIKANRQDILQLIEGISETELNKTGTHPVYGNLNIHKWTDFFLLHEAHHLLTIFQLANHK
ncbi:MAG TPA: DinB family protein, partial [Mucilaginibacter sp.]|nr:DinB family protein [Mucilaginibacter sp.]